jgi:hypothetical protein
MNSFLLWSLPYEPILDPQGNLLFLPYFQLSTKSDFQVTLMVKVQCLRVKVLVLKCSF